MLKGIHDYQYFNTQDFLEDDQFRQWVLEPTTQSESFWANLIKVFPEKQEPVMAAKHLLMSMYGHFDNEIQQIPVSQAAASYSNVAEKIEQHVGIVPMHRRAWLRWSSAAGILLLLGVVGFYFFNKEPLMQDYTTGNGERQTLKLPDSSVVQLNANSTLHFFPEKWSDGLQREVWLEGEAYFEVQKKAVGTRFIVHAGDMQVAVLGTRFNVRARGEKTEVVLAEGKVELAVAQQKIIMQPGDRVAYSKSDGNVETKRVKASDYAAWKDGIAVFNSSLREVVKELEIRYGISFRIENEALKNRHIQLSAPADNLEQVLHILELMYPEEITIKQLDGEVVIY